MGWRRRLLDEVFGVCGKRAVEGGLAGGVYGVGLSVWTWSGVIRPMPAWWWDWLYQAKSAWYNCLASSMRPKRRGNAGWHLRVLKWLSEKGLSLEVCGRLCDLVTPRSASRNAVALAFIGPPRPACRVSCPGGTWYLAMVSSNRAVNSEARSASAAR